MALVFISYAHEDEPFVARLTADLRQARVSIWWDRAALPPGSNWPLALQNAIEDSTHFVLVMSPHSVAASSFVQKELALAHSLDKTLVPILIRPCTPPLLAQGIQYIDFSTDYDRALARLLDVLPARATLSPPDESAPERYRRFWRALLDDAQQQHIDLHARVTRPGGKNMLAASAGYPGLKWRYAIHGAAASVQLLIATTSKGDNKDIFDTLAESQTEIEAAFGGMLEWARQDALKSSRILKTFPIANLTDENTWATTRHTLIKAMITLSDALRPYINALPR